MPKCSSCTRFIPEGAFAFHVGTCGKKFGESFGSTSNIVPPVKRDSFQSSTVTPASVTKVSGELEGVKSVSMLDDKAKPIHVPAVFSKLGYAGDKLKPVGPKSPMIAAAKDPSIPSLPTAETEIAELESELKVAIAGMEFEKCVELRDRIAALSAPATHPVRRSSAGDAVPLPLPVRNVPPPVPLKAMPRPPAKPVAAPSARLPPSSRHVAEAIAMPAHNDITAAILAAVPTARPSVIGSSEYRSGIMAPQNSALDMSADMEDEVDAPRAGILAPSTSLSSTNGSASSLMVAPVTVTALSSQRSRPAVAVAPIVTLEAPRPIGRHQSQSSISSINSIEEKYDAVSEAPTKARKAPMLSKEKSSSSMESAGSSFTSMGVSDSLSSLLAKDAAPVTVAAVGPASPPMLSKVRRNSTMASVSSDPKERIKWLHENTSNPGAVATYTFGRKSSSLADDEKEAKAEKEVSVESSTSLGLPVDWSAAMDSEGTPYYYNMITGESTWEKPVATWVATGWKVTCDEVGKIYYLNEVTGEKCYDKAAMTSREAESVKVARPDRGVWKESTSFDGSIYYYNTVTGQSKWPDELVKSDKIEKAPAAIIAMEAVEPEAVVASSAAATLPAGWGMAASETGVTYYYNSATGASQWEMPI